MRINVVISVSIGDNQMMSSNTLIIISLITVFLRNAGGHKKHEGVGTQKALRMTKGRRKRGARKGQSHLQTKQERGLKGTRKSYKAERNGEGGGAKPSKHEEEGRQM